VQMDLEDKVAISGVTTTLIYLYVVPAKVAGGWNAKVPASVSKGPVRLDLKQQVTRVSGSALLNGKEVALEDVKLKGDQLSFRLAGMKGTFSGTVKDNAISGTLDGAGPRSSWTASK